MSEAQNCINCNNLLKSKVQKTSEKSGRLRRRPNDGPDLTPSTSAACFIIEDSLNFRLTKTNNKKSETFAAESKTSMTESESRPTSKSKSLGRENKPSKAPVRGGQKSLEFDAKLLGQKHIEIFGKLDTKIQKMNFCKT